MMENLLEMIEHHRKSIRNERKSQNILEMMENNAKYIAEIIKKKYTIYKKL